MPLFNCNLESIPAKPLNSTYELAERAVTLFVKPAVVEEFIEGLLLASEEHSLECCESDFGDQKLVVMPIMA